MLDARSIVKHFGDVLILEDVSFRLRAGERAALVGPNGAGKSTLLRIVGGEIEPDSGSITRASGSRVAYLPQDAGVQPGRTLHEEMANVFGRIGEIEERQRALEAEMSRLAADDARLMRLVEEHAQLHAEFEHLDGYTVEAKIGRVLAGLGFGEADWQRPTEHFSGGWQMRIALARLLLQSPDVLLLDEPTNHLDLQATEWLEEYLVEARIAALIVSHDRYFLDRVTKRTLELRDGRIVDFPVSYTEYSLERARRDEAQLDAFERQQEYLAKQQAFVERFRASATKHTAAKSREKMLARIERIERPTDEKRIAFRFLGARPSGREVVQLDGVAKAYGENTVIDRANLLFERGERVGLVGPNGAGKSTLLKLIGGIERPDRGRVIVGHNVEPAMYSQSQAESLDPSKTVIDEVHLDSPVGVTQGEIRDLLGRFLFRQEDVFKKVAVLSGGERSRLALAKLLLRPSNLLMLDEPTNHLDIGSREVLEAALRAYEGTVIVASHDRYFLDRIATRIIEVEGATLTSYSGNYSYYRQKRVARLAATTAIAATASPTPARATVESEGQKRVKPEREARAAADRLAKLESGIDELTARRAKLEERLADPDLWNDPDNATKVVDDLERVQTEIEVATRRWEELVATT